MSYEYHGQEHRLHEEYGGYNQAVEAVQRALATQRKAPSRRRPRSRLMIKLPRGQGERSRARRDGDGVEHVQQGLLDDAHRAVDEVAGAEQLRGNVGGRHPPHTCACVSSACVYGGGDSRRRCLAHTPENR